MANDANGPKPEPDASDAVREVLGEVPSPAIPPDVSERILAAIAVESQTRSAEEKSNVSALPRSSRFRWLLPVAASAAAIALLGLLVWPLGGDGDTPETFAAGTGCTVSADAAADMSPVLHASGVTYTEVSLASQAESMAQQPVAKCGQATRNDARQAQVESSAPQEPRSEPTVRKCVVSVVEGRLVHAVDIATFDGQSAVVVVVASPREVLALSCGTGHPKVLAQRVLARQP